LSWGTVDEWPAGPVEVRFKVLNLAPGESAPLAEHAWPQLIFIDTDVGGPAVRLMITSGGGEIMPANGIEGGQPIDLDAMIVAAPGLEGTPGVGRPLRASRRSITPGVEATVGQPLLSEAAFLHPGSGGTLLNPSEAHGSISVVAVTFGEPADPKGGSSGT
jgi:hypothetical protein